MSCARQINGTIRSRSGLPAFTLVELICSMAAATLILGAAATGAALLSNGGASIAEKNEHQRMVSLALNRLRSELEFATAIEEATAHKIRFTSILENGATIEYAWSGAPGDPLVRTVNDGDARNVISACENFDLSVATENFSDSDGEETSSGEALLAKNDGYPLVSFLWHSSDTTVSDTNWMAFCFTLNNTKEEDGWRPARCRVSVKRNSSGTRGTLQADVYAANPTTHVPEGPILGTGSISISAIPDSYNWVQISFTSADLLPAGDFALVLHTIGASTTLSWRIDVVDYISQFENNLDGKYSTDSGTSWSPTSIQDQWDFRTEMYGEYASVHLDGVADTGVLLGVSYLLEYDLGDETLVLPGQVACVNKPSLRGVRIDAIETD